MMKGRCLCGDVSFEAEGAPDRVLHCHCESCRRHTGAAMATLAVFDPTQVTFSGPERQKYESAPNVQRGFCANCGSTLTWETVLGQEAICAIHISAFDDPNDLLPVGVSFYKEKIIWFYSHDALPRFEGIVRGAKPVQVGPK